MAAYKRKIAARLPGTDQYFVKQTTRPNVNWCVMTRPDENDQWRAMHWLSQNRDAQAKRNWWASRGFQVAIVRTQNWAD